MKVTAALAIVLAAGAVTFRILSGPSGASVAYGGTVETTPAPELAPQDAASWVNGAPTTLASLKGSPVILEIWSPT